MCLAGDPVDRSQRPRFHAQNQSVRLWKAVIKRMLAQVKIQYGQEVTGLGIGSRIPTTWKGLDLSLAQMAAHACSRSHCGKV
jgi:hypothetical protein